jgi:hypothetical protein
MDWVQEAALVPPKGEGVKGALQDAIRKTIEEAARRCEAVSAAANTPTWNLADECHKRIRAMLADDGGEAE